MNAKMSSITLGGAMPLAVPIIRYGNFFTTTVTVKNGGVSKSYRINIYLKDRDEIWRQYCLTNTPTMAPGETKSFTIDRTAPGYSDDYKTRIPAFSKAYLFGANPIRGTLNDGTTVLDDKIFENVFYAQPLQEIVIPIQQYCACTGIDPNTLYPINPKTTFSSSENLIIYIRVDYANAGGSRITFTNEVPGYIPMTSIHDIPSGLSGAYYVMAWGWGPPLARGTWHVWFQVGNVHTNRLDVSVV